ncbi:Long-chain-fatty-acid--CoA ligase [Hyphomicrobium sulfonivorans]|uniref:Long-chain-fatty-acid--CoA ligase n=1 Tax=Hyphomicrobium sulfonivorans TaxID=121290 RepID=A0A120CYF3_HYPSL|nr:long-chain fatty acid--CoA ligase [Hyphomicrobium sulfonivorans]KWT72420.1 Long-chain-fatty-acid--CoA ligase [Hyphomicrobium sulfonivorans]
MMTTVRPPAPAAAAEPTLPWQVHYPSGIDWHMPLKVAPLYALLDDAVRDYGHLPCTNFLGRTLSYGEIGDLVGQTAAALQRQGVRKGTKVGLFLPNSPTFIIYFFAVLKAGGTVVNFNPLYTVAELTHQVEDSDTELMITLDLKVLFDKVEALLQSGCLARALVAPFPSLLPATKAALFRLFRSRELARPLSSPVANRVTLEGEALAGAATMQPVAIDPENDVAVLQYTGGTTGTPKGAMLTHANVYINVQQVAATAPDLEPGVERVLGVLPFFHVFALTVVMNLGIAKAAEIIIMPRFALDDALKLIDRTKPTIMPGVPTLFNAIMNHPKIASFDLSSLKFCLSGGAALPIEVKQRFEAITGCKVVEGYGLSEASPVVACNPIDGPARAGSIGIPLVGTTISLRDLNNPELEVPLGEKGEICVKGPQVMKGYYKRPEDTAAQMVGEYLRTGDVACMDADGFFYIKDRIKDLIISSGFNVYPRRVEEALYEHPAVAEVTVIGIRDKKRGEAPKAFVRLKTDTTVTVAELMEHLQTRISRIELPAEIEFRAELPKTLIGKLSKKELKAEEDAKALA